MPVGALFKDRDGTLWVGCDQFLNRFDRLTEKFTRFPVPLVKHIYKPTAQGALFYLELVEDRDGTIWLGSQFVGLHHLDPATGKFIVYQHEINRPDSLSDNRVNSVYFDRSGAMWVGTQNGLNKFDRTTGRFTVYTRRDGLPGNAVGCVLEDNGGDLWMSTDNGVARFKWPSS